jgi:hypothetical protein
MAFEMISYGKCFFAFSHPSPHHLLSLVGRWVPCGSHAGSKNVREKMGGRMHCSISRSLPTIVELRCAIVQIILGSSSVARRTILAEMGHEFTIVVFFLSDIY